MKLLHLGAFRAMAASPVCASFSTAITPAWRNSQYRPDLSAEQKAKIDLGQQQLSFVKCLVEICILMAVGFGSNFLLFTGHLLWLAMMCVSSGWTSADTARSGESERAF